MYILQYVITWNYFAVEEHVWICLQDIRETAAVDITV